ncbi:MAG: hypothetical protein ABI165_12805, partial [Bryobacteraceae bacterium]
RQKMEIEERNRWSLELDALHKKALVRIAQLQDEFKAEQAAGRRLADAYDAKIAELEEENRRRADWARDIETRLTAEVAEQTAELVKCGALLNESDATLKQRTEWALDLDQQLGQCQSMLQRVRASRWVRLGNSTGLGPKL